MRQKIIVTAAALALALAWTPASARPIPPGGLTLEQVASWLQDGGYRAEIQEADGKRTIVSASDGSNWHISMYDCKPEGCGSLQFWVGFSTSGAYNPERINRWNKHNRWVRAYVDDTNDPFLEMDVDLTPGGTSEILDDQFSIWRDSLKKFRDHMH